ncbi:WD40 repeat [Macleaya cordata]|uniref:WD40 repeat n=1 Tax=Macleaya cordata TaxID=56857 RepID=A0A200QPD0_MACCD|nr:WD40 repeat [Macleaya cordata]
MQSFGNESEEDLFFDTVDYIRSSGDCESSAESVSGIGGLDYTIWTNEPGSVKERREKFLQGMGFSEFVHSELGCSQKLDEEMARKNFGLDRISECSGAVSCSWCLYENRGEEDLDLVSSRRYPDGRTKLLVNEIGHKGFELTTTSEFETTTREVTADGEKCDRPSKKQVKRWWKRVMHKRKGRGGILESVTVKNREVPNRNRMKVRNHKKRCMEFTAVYMGQEVEAHNGFIWTMKFSPDGQYLASGGEDGVVRIWRITSTNAAEGGSKFVDKVKETKYFLGRRNSNPASVVIPKKVFKIEESPLQEFHGHTSDVLDLCWSKSNCLLSSSKDNTVRLWHVGSDECLQIFNHNNYVTCIQFNPVDDGYFISGSIDGKVRIWRVSERRVVDWADVRDIVTAICYQPDGQGFIVGSITGRCRFYDASGNNLQMNAQIRIHCRKKSSSNRITGFQFSPEDSERVMVTSADSKVRIFEGASIIHKYKGLRKSGSQLSASFTSDGKHIISVGEDSRVYVWNCNDLCVPSSKHTKSTRSCEHFFFEGVSVAIPWSGTESEQMRLSGDSSRCSSKLTEQLHDACSCSRDSERFSLGSCFSMDGLSRGSATWPEEKLPLWAIPITEHDYHHHQQEQPEENQNHTILSASWGMVIVTAGWDGVIRTFHNYGLPVRL